jgi:hypothetical protein
MGKDYKAIGRIVDLIEKKFYSDEKLFKMGFTMCDLDEARFRIWMRKKPPRRCPKCNILSVQFVEPNKCYACEQIEMREFAIKQEMKRKRQQQRNLASA